MNQTRNILIKLINLTIALLVLCGSFVRGVIYNYFYDKMQRKFFLLIINFIRRKLSKLSIVELTIGDSYWIETFTIDPYYRDTWYRNASIFRCIGPPLLTNTPLNCQVSISSRVSLLITARYTVVYKQIKHQCTDLKVYHSYMIGIFSALVK